jgi:hypothetical protein
MLTMIPMDSQEDVSMIEKDEITQESGFRNRKSTLNLICLALGLGG